MRPSRNNTYSGRYRTRRQSCPQYLRSTWPTIHPDNEEHPLTDMAAILAAMKHKGILPMAYSTHALPLSDYTNIIARSKFARKPTPVSRTSSSTPALRSHGDTDDTEDEGYSNRRCSSASTSSHGSYEHLRKQATSMGSLSSSYSSLGDRSTRTLSPMDDINLKQSFSTSLKAMLNPDYVGELFDYDQDPTMRKTIEDIVSPRPRKSLKSKPKVEVSLTAVDPSVLVALPANSGIPAKYAPTDLCDLSQILTGAAPSDVADSQTDLALLRVGSLPVNDDTMDEVLGRREWDIPSQEDDDRDPELQTRISYQLLNETFESDEEVCLLSCKSLNLSFNSSSSSSSPFRSRSSSLSTARDSSDYLADISSEEATSRCVTVWPPSKKLKLEVVIDSAPFVLPPRIPGVPYYDVPTSILSEGEGQVSRGLEAFFKNRSIVHRLGPHGLEQVYDMEVCPGRCGFEFPVPSKQEVVPTLKV